MSVRRDGSAAVLTLVGDFDMHTVQSVVQPVDELLQDPPRDLVVDLSGVEFIDSSGIALLVKVYARVVREGEGTMRVERSSPVARRLLEVCGLLDTFGMNGTGPPASG
jgi:anti-anti-sigma factor